MKAKTWKIRIVTGRVGTMKKITEIWTSAPFFWMDKHGFEFVSCKRVVGGKTRWYFLKADKYQNIEKAAAFVSATRMNVRGGGR